MKFYFNDCFPATDENRAFVRRTLQAAGRSAVRWCRWPRGCALDDHDGDEPELPGVQTLPADLHPRDNLAVQTAIVAGASAFVGTYGGFSYLAPFFGVRSTAYYANSDGFSRRHLAMARSALASIGAGDCSTSADGSCGTPAVQ